MKNTQPGSMRSTRRVSFKPENSLEAVKRIPRRQQKVDIAQEVADVCTDSQLQQEYTPWQLRSMIDRFSRDVLQPVDNTRSRMCRRLAQRSEMQPFFRGRPVYRDVRLDIEDLCNDPSESATNDLRHYAVHSAHIQNVEKMNKLELCSSLHHALSIQVPIQVRNDLSNKSVKHDSAENTVAIGIVNSSDSQEQHYRNQQITFFLELMKGTVPQIVQRASQFDIHLPHHVARANKNDLATYVSKQILIRYIHSLENMRTSSDGDIEMLG
jgi:hypothetical protein